MSDKVFIRDLVYVPKSLISPEVGRKIKTDLLLQQRSYQGSGDVIRAWGEVGGYVKLPRHYALSRLVNAGLLGQGVEVDDRRVAPEIEGDVQFTGTLGEPSHLYDHRQPEFVDEVVRKTQGNGVGGFGIAYCGGGKTVLGSAIIERLKLRTLIVVNKNFLAAQWAESLKTFLRIDGKPPSVGVVRGSKCQYGDRFPVSVATVQTLSQKEFPSSFYSSWGLVILDEGHHCPATTYRDAMSRFVSRYTIGVTATLRRKDGLASLFSHWIGPVLYEMKRENIAAKVYYIRYPWTGPRLTKSTPMHVINRAIADDEKANNRIVGEIQKAFGNGRKVLLLSALKDHLNTIYNMLPKEILEKTGYYVGGMKQADLDANAKRCSLLLATNMMAQEGLDIKALDTLMLTTPISDVEQAAGRILRPCEDKQLPVVIDFVPQVQRLIKTASKRNALYRREGMEIVNKYEEN